MDPTKFYTPYSPDFNPSEFIIYTVKENAFKKLQNKKYPTRQEVINAITEAWNEIPLSLIKKSIKYGWRKRLKQCIKNNGDFGNISFGSL